MWVGVRQLGYNVSSMDILGRGSSCMANLSNRTWSLGLATRHYHKVTISSLIYFLSSFLASGIALYVHICLILWFFLNMYLCSIDHLLIIHDIYHIFRSMTTNYCIIPSILSAIFKPTIYYLLRDI